MAVQSGCVEPGTGRVRQVGSRRRKVVIGILLAIALFVVGSAWWALDRPFGGATCWVNYTAKTYDQALALESNLVQDGLDARAPGLKAGRPPALPVVTVRGGFWKTEASLEEEVSAGLAEVGGGNFDQCNTPSLGD